MQVRGAGATPESMAAQSLGDVAVAASCTPDSFIVFNRVDHLKCRGMFCSTQLDLLFVQFASSARRPHRGNIHDVVHLDST
jgi:hypothetical protein